jgi:hypothetical protein
MDKLVILVCFQVPPPMKGGSSSLCLCWAVTSLGWQYHFICHVWLVIQNWIMQYYYVRDVATLGWKYYFVCPGWLFIQIWIIQYFYICDIASACMLRIFESLGPISIVAWFYDG